MALCLHWKLCASAIQKAKLEIPTKPSGSASFRMIGAHSNGKSLRERRWIERSTFDMEDRIENHCLRRGSNPHRFASLHRNFPSGDHARKCIDMQIFCHK